MKRIIWISTLLILVSWLLTYFLLKDLEPEQRGTIGDMFGSVNALFSGLALAGIIFSILLQRLELGYQREELRETRKEFIAQNDTLRKQRFENTFFNLIKLYQDTFENMKVDVNGYEYTKARSFQKMYDQLSIVINKRMTRNSIAITLPEDELVAVIRNQYRDFYLKYEPDLAHYIRIIRNILNFIDTTDLLKNNTEKEFYASIFIDQISALEVQLLFYHTFCKTDLPNLSLLVSKYDLLRNLNKNRLLGKNHFAIAKQ